LEFFCRANSIKWQTDVTDLSFNFSLSIFRFLSLWHLVPHP
jgi:hypothetical protein